jgi:hypothetical protein
MEDIRMWRALSMGTLFCVCLGNASMAEDACISIPNGIMCGQLVPNPGLVIRPSSSPLPDKDDRRETAPPQRFEDDPDRRREMRRDERLDGRRGEQIDERRVDKHVRPGEGRPYERERRRTERPKPRDMETSSKRKRKFEGRDRYSPHYQAPDERQFRDMKRRIDRNRDGQFEDRYGESPRIYKRRVERNRLPYDERRYDRRWD